MKELSLTERYNKCIKEKLCFVSMKPLVNKFKRVIHFGLNTEVNVNPKYIKY